MSKVDYDSPDYEPDEIDAAIDRCIDRVLHRQEAESALEREQSAKAAKEQKAADESALARVRRMINAPRTEGSN